jgi:hypothetical protein
MISLSFVLGDPYPLVMSEAGHASPQMTLGIYARAMEASDEDRDRLRALVEGSYGHKLGKGAAAASGVAGWMNASEAGHTAQ